MGVLGGAKNTADFSVSPALSTHLGYQSGVKSRALRASSKIMLCGDFLVYVFLLFNPSHLLPLLRAKKNYAHGALRAHRGLPPPPAEARGAVRCEEAGCLICSSALRHDAHLVCISCRETLAPPSPPRVLTRSFVTPTGQDGQDVR